MVLASQGVDEVQGLGKLSGPDEEPGTVDLPIGCGLHNAHTLCEGKSKFRWSMVEFKNQAPTRPKIGFAPGGRRRLRWWCGESTQEGPWGQFHSFGAVAGKPVEKFEGAVPDRGDCSVVAGNSHGALCLLRWKGEGKKSAKLAPGYFHSESTEFAERQSPVLELVSGTLAVRVSLASEGDWGTRAPVAVGKLSTTKDAKQAAKGAQETTGEMMMRRQISSLVVMIGIAGVCAGQSAVSAGKSETGRSTVYVECGVLWDGKAEKATPQVRIAIAMPEGKIVSVQPHQKNIGLGTASGSVAHVDLSNQTCLPGLIDTHTHILLQGDITAADYDVQLLKESPEYRTIVATQNARRALEYGFTTIRDLETEGAGYADVDVKKAINNGVIPGPRMQVATRALDVTGAYPLQGYAPGVAVPHGVELVDGAEEARKAVREQISYGADWIKVYSDRSYRVREDGVLDDIPTFTLDELRAIVDEAHREKHRVASHAMALNGVHNSVAAGVDTIEHGNYIADDDLRTMATRGIYYVPTIFVGEYVAEGRAAAGAPVWVKMLSIHKETFRRALKAGVQIAFGTDAGGFDWGIDPAKEFRYMVKWGMTPLEAMRASTLSAAKLLGIENEV